jgi:hypothetical protein
MEGVVVATIGAARQVRVVAAGLADGESCALMEICVSEDGDMVTFELGDDAVFTTAHPEIRVMKSALPEAPCEEWEEARAMRKGQPASYWFSNATKASVWKEPKKYYPVKFKRPPKKTASASEGGDAAAAAAAAKKE